MMSVATGVWCWQEEQGHQRTVAAEEASPQFHFNTWEFLSKPLLNPIKEDTTGDKGSPCLTPRVLSNG
jgi:hypothetical protein